jgi:hypothetical protein
MGGMTITSDAEARAVRATILAHPKVWGELGMERDPQVRVGDDLQLDPCVDIVRHQAMHGRACPYVELWPENEIAARLVFAALPDHTRPLMAAYADALTADLAESDARAIVIRTVRVLQSEPVLQWRAAQWKRPTEEGDA